MAIVVEKEGSLVVLALEGRMDAVAAPEFDQQAAGLLDQGQTRFLLDLSQLQYISSAGLRSILSLAKKVDQCQGSLVLCGLGGMVMNVFDISGFSDLFTVCADRGEALDRMG